MRPGYILRASLLPLALLLWACERPPAPTPRYVLGGGYQTSGTWYYPRESFALNQTGLAAVAQPGKSGLTANGEAYDADAMAAGHQTLQLPAIARVTNMETGTQLAVRINDRGPARPNRMLELTPRAAALLGVPAAGGTRIRLEVLEPESRRAVEGLAGTPRLQVTAAPRESVRAESLDGTVPPAASPASQPAGPAEEAAARVEKLPETVTRTAPTPGMLFIRLGDFGRREFAERQRARVAALGAFVETERRGRDTTYRVRIGPLASVAEADDMLDRAIRSGISEARIYVAVYGNE